MQARPDSDAELSQPNCHTWLLRGSLAVNAVVTATTVAIYDTVPAGTIQQWAPTVEGRAFLGCVAATLLGFLTSSLIYRIDPKEAMKSEDNPFELFRKPKRNPPPDSSCSPEPAE